MQLNITKKATFSFLLVVFFVFLDKLFKTLALKGHLDEPIYIIKNFFSLHFVKNYNIAFSLPFSGPWLNIFIVLIILILIIWYSKLLLQKNKGQLFILYYLTFLIIGAIINLIDRIKFGYVIDYFDLRYFTVFNVADIMITGSIIGLFLAVMFFRKN